MDSSTPKMCKESCITIQIRHALVTEKFNSVTFNWISNVECLIRYRRCIQHVCSIHSKTTTNTNVCFANFIHFCFITYFVVLKQKKFFWMDCKIHCLDKNKHQTRKNCIVIQSWNSFRKESINRSNCTLELQRYIISSKKSARSYKWLALVQNLVQDYGLIVRPMIAFFDNFLLFNAIKTLIDF